MGHSRFTALLEDTYVDDIQGGGEVEEDATTFKDWRDFQYNLRGRFHPT